MLSTERHSSFVNHFVQQGRGLHCLKRQIKKTIMKVLFQKKYCAENLLDRLKFVVKIKI